jgi:gamma-glutamylaminecyclotransferase
MTDKHFIAVYGTLKQGRSNAGLLHSAVFVGAGVTALPYGMVDTGGFPCVFNHDSGLPQGKVVVELYEVSTPQLARLDQLEGHPTMFCRQDVLVALKDGPEVEAEMYFGTPEYWKRYLSRCDAMPPDDTGVISWPEGKPSLAHSAENH